MRYTLIWAALALLVLAAWWSIGHKEEGIGVGLGKGVPGSNVSLLGERLGLQVRQVEVVDDLMLPLVQGGEAKVDENEIARLYAQRPEWPDLRAAASEVVVLPIRADTPAAPVVWDFSTLHPWPWLVTFYSCACRDLTTCIPEGFCGKMRSGITVYEGAAACDPRLTDAAAYLVLAGSVYQCMDTGSMVRGRHVDVFFYYQEDGWEFLRQWGDRQIVEVIYGDNPSP